MQNHLFHLWLLLVAVPLSPGAWAESRPPKSKETLALVSGQAIYGDDLLPLIQAQLRQLRGQEYDLKSRALERVVSDKLLEAEAKKRGIAVDKLLEQEVDSKIKAPTDAELEAYYLGQKDRMNRPLAEVKAQLQQALKQAKSQQARQDYANALRVKAEVSILLRPPKTEVAYDAGRVRGDPKAPVMIVEFSDFQCPYCRKAQPALKELLEKYPGRVSLAYRDFPLRQIHPQAQGAAEASRCAGEQGKFWEYHDALVAGKLDREGLVEHARGLSLDEKRFETCLESGKYRALIEQDLQEGTQAGVSGTPAFFVNGVFLSGAQPLESFVRVIDEELAQKH